MRTALLLFTLLIASTASAASPKPADDFVEVRAAAAFNLRPDRAYLLFRTNSKETRVYVGFSPVFLRIPTAEEMQAYDAAKRAAFAKAETDLKRRREELLAQKTAAERSGRRFTKAIPPVPDIDNFDLRTTPFATSTR